jgi:coenzyme F420 hydrogenase subunit beta
MTVKLIDGETVFLDLRYYWSTYFSSYFFTPLRCLLCNDGTAQLADISVGDAWLPELKDDLGTSLIITRTDIGEKLINSAYTNKIINICPQSFSIILRSQKSNLSFKNNLIVRLNVAKKILKRKIELLGNIPSSNCHNPFPYFFAFLPLANSLMSKRSLVYKILMRIPVFFLNLNGVTIDVLNRISSNIKFGDDSIE